MFFAFSLSIARSDKGVNLLGRPHLGRLKTAVLNDFSLVNILSHSTVMDFTFLGDFYIILSRLITSIVLTHT